LAEKEAAEAMAEAELEEVDLSGLLIDDNTDEEVLEKIAAAQAAEAAARLPAQEAEATD
jgi:hypothetical protein